MWYNVRKGQSQVTASQLCDHGKQKQPKAASSFWLLLLFMRVQLVCSYLVSEASPKM
jgi:hypothetical protein